MAKPRVFVSSTYYDLKHLRSSLDRFIDSLGFEPVLSEKGDIAFTPDVPLAESCYREAAGADIFVLVIGGRYGAEASGKQKTQDRKFFERYESITKKEYESAITRDIPIYILVENDVYAEYHTYLRNKDNNDITYAHVDSVNVFHLIEEILSKPRNNPTHTFEKFAEIEIWLREQWAGLFRELLQKQSQQHQLSALGAQVSELRAINETLRKYLEAVMTGMTREASSRLIESEKKRLELERNERIRENTWCSFVTSNPDISFTEFIDAMIKSSSFTDFAKNIKRKTEDKESITRIERTLKTDESARRDFNEVRKLLGLSPIGFTKSELPESERETGDSKPPDMGDKK